MKLVAYAEGDRTLMGVLDASGGVCEIGEIGQFWQDPAAALGKVSKSPVALSSLRERPAVPPSARVVCVGLNYRLHAQESGMPIPTVPVIFSRWARTLSVTGSTAPRVDEKFDWEGELGVVIGRRMFRVSVDQAADGIFGYVAFNDLSARSYQTQTTQWTMGKNSDASGPMTPIVTQDEVGDPASGLQLTTRLNGRTVQDSTTADMIFSVPQLIAHISEIMTLEPGDLIITGTPSGVGMATGKFLEPGDVVEVEIEKIGSVRTTIVEAPETVF